MVVFTYNGLGDRLSETINGVTTIFTLDLHAGLTQVLADNTHVYLYGLGRIAQISGSESVYFLGDALGSVRQLADGPGTVILTRSYEPYGSVLSTVGTDATKYGFTGEWQENGLVFLRARYYYVNNGLFSSRDPWSGDYLHPLSYSSYIYGYDNPIRYTDPSGWFISQAEAKDADKIADELLSLYNVTVERDWGYRFEYGCTRWTIGRWSLIELQLVQEALSELARNAFINYVIMQREIGPITLRMTDSTCGRGCTAWSGTLIELLDSHNPPTKFDKAIANGNFDKWTVVHEFAHAWDRNHGWTLQNQLQTYTLGFTGGTPEFCEITNSVPDFDGNALPGCNFASYFYGGVPPKGSDSGFNKGEDFAESVTALVYPVPAQEEVQKFERGSFTYIQNGKILTGFYGQYLYYDNYRNMPRYNFINSLA